MKGKDDVNEEEVTLRERYPEVERFADLMRCELFANRHKGDQTTWKAFPANSWSYEIAWHLAKLMAAYKDGNNLKIIEHAADIANGAMMMIDGLGLL